MAPTGFGLGTIQNVRIIATDLEDLNYWLATLSQHPFKPWQTEYSSITEWARYIISGGYYSKYAGGSMHGHLYAVLSIYMSVQSFSDQ
jgi:hypothetical protein